MEGGHLDLEESRRILEEGEEESDVEEEEEDEEGESIKKLSSFTFHPESKERGEGEGSSPSKALTKSPTRTLTRGARLTSHMDDDDEDFEDDGKDDSVIRDNEESDEEFANKLRDLLGPTVVGKPRPKLMGNA